MLRGAREKIVAAAAGGLHQKVAVAPRHRRARKLVGLHLPLVPRKGLHHSVRRRAGQPFFPASTGNLGRLVLSCQVDDSIEVELDDYTKRCTMRLSQINSDVSLSPEQLTVNSTSNNAMRQGHLSEVATGAQSSADLADQLKAAVERSGLSVNQVAREAGIPQQVLQRFLSGKRHNVRLDTASKLAGFFGMRLTKPQNARRPRRWA